ncbi:metal ABC transporter substrate-binding protein [Ruminococcus sp.]|uniref:metal ABC transporter substrate-binding protein n=1 Tax=Ruminococcus sp. TaxID=41978 RepID=UPI0025E6A374|nr:metal ABC transporter substrate-binding protein [Ruminococcus sp.]MBR1430661.1 zinc ABC transporter substrate-binding protein [Ruminococcus sp.]
MFIRKTGIISLAMAVAAAGLTGCGASRESDTAAVTGGANTSGKLSVVCTIFPEYDWVKQIMGDHADEANVTYLLSSGTDLHNYQPTASDIMSISSCDIFIHVGGESDKWVDDALDEAVNKDMQVIDLLELLGDSAKEEEIKEGMEAEEEEEEDGGDEVEYDEHVWLSLKNAKVVCNAISEALSKADPDNAEDYSSSLDDYTKKLDDMDESFRAVTENAENKTLIFGDRFPFRYLFDDYGLDYYAAFVGCSAESEASFSTISFLSDKLNELECDTIFTIENSDKSIAEAVIRNSDRKDCTVAELNSIQSVSMNDVNSGVTYLSLMQQNCDVLAEYLG